MEARAPLFEDRTLNLTQRIEAASLQPLPTPIFAKRDGAYATHEGAIDMQGMRLRVLRLSDGQRTLDPRSFDSIVLDVNDEAEPPARTLLRNASILELGTVPDDRTRLEQSVLSIADHPLMNFTHGYWSQLQAMTSDAASGLEALHDFFFGSPKLCHECKTGMQRATGLASDSGRIES